MWETCKRRSTRSSLLQETMLQKSGSCTDKWKNWYAGITETRELGECRREFASLARNQQEADSDPFEEERTALIDQLNELQRTNNKMSREHDKSLRQLKDRMVAVHAYFFGQSPQTETGTSKQGKSSTECERQVELMHSCLDSLVEKIDESKERLTEATEDLLSEMDSRVNDSMKLLSTKVRLIESRVERLATLTRSALSAVSAKNSKLKQTVDLLVEERSRRAEEEKRVEAESVQLAQRQATLLSIDAVMRGVVKACDGISAVFSKMLQQAPGPATTAADPDSKKIEEGRAALARYMHETAMGRLAEVRALAGRLAGAQESPRGSVDSSS